MDGPLQGIRVLEFTEAIAGPLAGMLLADMGADVIKVEPPWGDPARFMGQFIPLERQYISLNRGKRSLPMDLAKPKAREIVYHLVPQMDVIIINNRPDVPYKLGIDYETLSGINPRLVYCENTAYGRRGPQKQRPGYDIIIQAMSGLMAADGKIVNGVPQQISATALADFAAGLVMAWGICAGLYAREKTGRGQKVETTLLAAALAIQTTRFLQVDRVDGEARSRFLEDLVQLRRHGRPYQEVQAAAEALRTQRVGNIYYRTFQTKDSVIAVGCLNDPLSRKMKNALQLRDIRFEPGYDPSSPEAISFGKELTRQAEALFLEKTTEEWLRILDAAGVPCGPVKFTEELLEDEQVLSNELVVGLEHSLAGPLKMVGPIMRMSETPLEAKSASPALGQHTSAILTSLGYGPEEIRRLREEGVTL